MIFRTVVTHAKKHPGLIPQFFFICLGMGGASLYLIRLAKGPHVTSFIISLQQWFFTSSMKLLESVLWWWNSSWNKTNNPEPWNKLDPTYQYKFVAINTDYKNLKKEGPEY